MKSLQMSVQFSLTVTSPQFFLLGCRFCPLWQTQLKSHQEELLEKLLNNQAWLKRHYTLPVSKDLKGTLGIDHNCQVKDFVVVVSQKHICKLGNITTFICLYLIKGLPRCFCSIEFACQYRRHRRHEFNPWVGKICWSRKWQPTPVFLPGKSHGQRCLVGYSLWGHKESDRSEHAYMHRHPYLIKKRSYIVFS